METMTPTHRFADDYALIIAADIVRECSTSVVGAIPRRLLVDLAEHLETMCERVDS